MFRFNDDLFCVGEIVILCWPGSNGKTQETRGRLIEIKQDIKPPYERARIKFIIETSGKVKERLSFVLRRDMHIQKVI